MNLNERNYAGDHFVVGSLEVLGNIKGGGVKEIRKNVDLIQKQAEMIAKQQNQYWTDLSSDGVITPVEKQMLLKEYKAIQQSYAAIYTQAVSVGLDITPIFQDYMDVYDDLHTYLYETLKLFDDMNSDTKIDDRTIFDSKFSGYYYDESYVLIALSKGIIDTVNFRVLTSLNEPGQENDIGIYRGGLYQYLGGEWRSVSTGNYKGALQTIPVGIDKDFFLVAADFTITEGLYVNGEQLYVNGTELAITRKYKKGYIYYCDNEQWYVVTDKTDYRYVAAFADVLRITGELPEIFQEALDALEEEIQNIHIPSYLGAMSTLPQNPINGDYFVYSGTNSGQWRKSDVYRYENGVWERLDPALSQNSHYYMQALEDILTMNEVGNGYFATLFSDAFFANSASINSLGVRTIYLKSGGAIQSENTAYISHMQGLRIDSDGNFDANGNSHIKGNCQIEGRLQIDSQTYCNGPMYVKDLYVSTGHITTRNFEIRYYNVSPVRYYFYEGDRITNSVRNVDGRISSTGSFAFDEILVSGGEVTFWYNNVPVTDFSGNAIYLPNGYVEEGMTVAYSPKSTGPVNRDTILMHNLPDALPGLPDIVWRDSNGFLRLS